MGSGRYLGLLNVAELLGVKNGISIVYNACMGTAKYIHCINLQILKWKIVYPCCIHCMYGDNKIYPLSVYKLTNPEIDDSISLVYTLYE